MIHLGMTPKLFLIVAAAFAAALGTAVQQGVFPQEYVGLITGLASVLASLVRPPESK